MVKVNVAETDIFSDGGGALGMAEGGEVRDDGFVTGIVRGREKGRM